MWTAMSISQSTLTFGKAFRGKYTALADKIDTAHGLMNQLLDKEVLTSQQIASCQVPFSLIGMYNPSPFFPAEDFKNSSVLLL